LPIAALLGWIAIGFSLGMAGRAGFTHIGIVVLTMHAVAVTCGLAFSYPSWAGNGEDLLSDLQDSNICTIVGILAWGVFQVAAWRELVRNLRRP
jgi:hypothetical protein